MVIWVRLAIMAVFVGGALPHQASADPQAPMSFTFNELDARMMGMGLMQTVFAEGIITPGTATRLAVFLDQHHVLPGGMAEFNSAGGDLGACPGNGFPSEGWSEKAPMGSRPSPMR